MTIRAEKPDDVAAIRSLVTACFKTPAEATLIDRLRAAGRLTVSRVAVADGEVVGHVGFSPVQVDGRETDGVGLAPLAVAAGHRRVGIGAALVNAGLDACRARGDGFVVVLGDPKYYGRFGFVPASRHQLAGEFGGVDAFAVIELRAGALPAGGMITYALEFAIFK